MVIVEDIWLCPPTCRKIHYEDEVAVIFGLSSKDVYRLRKYGLRAISRSARDAAYPCLFIQECAYLMEVPIAINYTGKFEAAARKQAFDMQTEADKAEAIEAWRFEVFGHRYRKGFVYLMKSAGLYKIGMSKNVERRRNALDQQPNRVEIVHKVAVSNMHWCERYLHERFSDYRLSEKREWFQLPQEAIDWICALKDGDLNEQAT